MSNYANNVFGMGVSAVASLFFIASSAVIQVSEYPQSYLLQARCLQQFVISILVLLFYRYVWEEKISVWGAPEIRHILWARAILYWVSTVSFWQSLKFMDLGDATTILYFYPVFSSIVGFVWLKEPWTWSFPIFAGLNCIGLFLIAQPGVGPNSLSPAGVIFGLISALTCGMWSPLTRLLKETHWLTVQLYAYTASAFIFNPLLIISQSLHEKKLFLVDSLDINFFNETIIISFFGFIALALGTIGSQYAYVNCAALMNYLEIPFSYIFSYYVFHTQLNIWSYIGCGLIVASGILSAGRQFLLSKYSDSDVLDAGIRFSSTASFGNLSEALAERTPLLQDAMMIEAHHMCQEFTV